MTRTARIYHLTPESELRAGCAPEHYAPARLPDDGFVHCAGSRDVTLSVAADYYAGIAEPLYVLAIDCTKLTARLRFEAPAPIPGGGRAHLDEAETFPHVFGPIDRVAIVEAGVLAKVDNAFLWPDRWEALDAVLTRS